MEKIARFELIPLKSAGPFIFNSCIDDYKDILVNYDFHPNIAEFGDDLYICKDDSHTLNVFQAKIDSVNFEHNLVYKNTPLIGLSIEEFQKIVGYHFSGEPEQGGYDEEEDEKSTLYYFDAINAMVWVDNKTNVIKSINVAGKYTED